MAKFNIPINNFSLGEVSSKFFGRYDSKDFSSACRDLKNSIVRSQGGAYRRPGSRYVTNKVATVAMTGKVRMVPFVVSKTEAYIIVIGTGTASDTNWPNSPLQIYSLVTENWVTATLISSSWVAYSSSQLNELKFSQSGDVMIITHADHEPIVITRYDTSFFLYRRITDQWQVYYDPIGGVAATTQLSPQLVNNVPFRDINTDTAFTLTLGSGSTGSTSITSSKNLFATSHVGARFRILIAGTEGWGFITAVTNATTATITMVVGTGSTSASADWFEGSWSNARGWPRSIVFHQNRSVYGGNNSERNALWFSQVGDIYELMRPRTTPTDADAFSFSLASSDNNGIQWLNSGKTLTTGTLTKEWLITPTDPNSSLSASNFDAEEETAIGSEYVQPLKLENSLIFVQRNGQKLREFVFNFDENSYQAKDLNYYADHIWMKAYDYGYTIIIPPKIINICKQEGDNQLIWTIDSYGVLNVLSRDRISGSLAWTPIVLGGSDGSVGLAPPKVLTMCTVPSFSGLDDELWMQVERNINGSTVYYLEKITREFFKSSLFPVSTESHDAYPYYSDASKEKVTAGSTTFSGFDHLEGETVDVVADGNYVGTKVVSGGIITLSSSFFTVIAGYSYRNIVAPLLPDAGSQIGSSVGAIKRIAQIAIRFRRTVTAYFGRDTDNLEEITFRESSTPMSDPIDLFTGLKQRDFSGDYDRDPEIYIVNDQPQPMEVTSFSAVGQTYD